MDWTYEQAKAIETRNKNILVAAAAGSGKTAVLVERIIRFVLEEHIDLDKLLVVTFTNAAASQMREKILEAIYKKLEDMPDNEELQRQIVLMNKASISTIHSFCLEVIRNYFYEIDISANFRIGDNSEIELLKQESLLELFEKKYENDDEDFKKLIDYYTDYHGDEKLQEMVLKVFEFIQSFPFPEQWLANSVEFLNRSNNLEEDFSNTIWGKILLDNYKEELKKYKLEYMILKQTIGRYSELQAPYRVLCEDIDAINSLIDNSKTWEEAANIVYITEFPKWKSEKNVDMEIQNTVKTKRSALGRAMKELMKNTFEFDSKQANEDINHMYPIIKALANLVLDFKIFYENMKKEKNIIDFNDIEHLALKILVKKNEDGEYEKTDVAKAYSEKFVAIAIDEYQDSNLIQEYILNTISRGNNIFMVGDIKQSIYRFRQARPELFLEKYDKYPKVDEAEEDNAKIQLFKNFRSRANILNITNLVFESIMSREFGDVEYNNEEFLNLGAIYDDNETKSELHIIETKKEESDGYTDIFENAELEAKFVAKRIKELINEKYQVQEKGIKRKIQYKDIVILSRAVNGVADIYEKALSEEQIPVFSDCGGSYLESSEIRTIISLLKIIDNPNQDIDLVAVMRSPIGNFTDNELVKIRLCNKKGTYYEALKESDGIKEKKFLKLIEKLQNMQEYMPLHELIWYIYQDTGYYDYMTVLPNGKQKTANLKLLFETAKQYEKASFKGLFHFINFTEKLQKKGQDLGAAKIIGENDDVVRIMSIHKSKGLEFPVVFLCSTGKGFNLRELNDPVILHQELGFGTKFVDLDMKLEYNTLAKQAVKIKSKTEAISEEMRVLYVALTRAKEKLIIVGTKKNIEEDINKKTEVLNIIKEKKIPKSIVKSEKSYLDWLLLVNIFRKDEMEKELDVIIHNKNEFISEKVETKKEIILWEKNKTVSKSVLEKLTWVYPNAISCQIPSKTSVSNLKQDKKYNSTLVFNKPKFLESENAKISGAQKGTVMHVLMQTLDLKCKYDMESLNNHIQKLVYKNILTELEAECINKENVIKFINSELATELRCAKEIQKEKPFYLNIQASRYYECSNEDYMLVQGIIDLYFRNKDDKLILVDYKTDYVENENILIEKYKNQLELYKEAIEKATGEKVYKSYIYSLHLGKSVEVSI